jgi:hypothetical protein
MVIIVAAAEELPCGSRAYGISVLALAAALGSGMAVWALPLADLGTKGWRLIYVIPVLGLPLTRYVAKRLPETKRFEIGAADGTGQKGFPHQSTTTWRCWRSARFSF